METNFRAAADDADGRLVVFWHHGSPNIETPPEPLFSAAESLDIRWVSYDRPGYGGSTPCRAGTWRRPPPMPLRSPTRLASTASRSWVTPAAVRTP